MRRLTILLATLGALMLVPAASAFAVFYSGNVKVNMTGNGSGEVKSRPDDGFWHPPNPPINCSYNGSSASGSCEGEVAEVGEAEEEEERFFFYVSAMEATAAPGSEFSGWTLQKGGGSCPQPSNPNRCIMESAEEGDDVFEALAAFCLEGQAFIGGTCVPSQTLTIAKEGTGGGTVVSNPAGIECGGKCKAPFETNAKVTLTASPTAGSTFVSWKGCEKGGVNGRQCTVTMDAAKTVSVKFLDAYDVTVNRKNTIVKEVGGEEKEIAVIGLGKVSSSPGGVLCLSNCSSTKAAFKEGTSVTLTAAPSKNYVFTEWTGDCSGSSLTCSLGSLGADKTVGAKFTPVAQHSLFVQKSGGGNGTVKSNVAGINCGATCSSMASAYFLDTVVELTATPGKGSSFDGWSVGSGCSGTGTCTVTMSAAKSVTAQFK